MKKLIIFVFLFRCITARAECPEIHVRDFQGPMDPEARPSQFINVGDKEMLLPQRSAYKGTIKNGDGSILAINYHETSNFDSVDLVICRGDIIALLPNLWDYLENKLLRARILKSLAFDDCYLSVTAIRNQTLYCQLTGTSFSTHEDVSIKFTVSIETSVSKIEFKLEKL